MVSISPPGAQEICRPQFETRVIYFRLREDGFVVFSSAQHTIMSAKGFRNSYLRLIGRIYPCQFRLLVSYPVQMPTIKPVSS